MGQRRVINSDLNETLHIIYSHMNLKNVHYDPLPWAHLRELVIYRSKLTIIRDEIKWSQLSPLLQRSLEERGATLSGCHSTLKSILTHIPLQTSLDLVLHGYLLISLINNQNPNLLQNTIPQEIKYYIERRISSRRLILSSEKIFKSGGRDIFMITGIKRHELSTKAYPQPTDKSSNQKHLNKPSVRFMLLDMLSDFQEISAKVTSTTVHVLEYTNGNFFWVHSSKQVDAIQNAVDDIQRQPIVEEDTFLNELNNSKIKMFDNSPVLLSDTPGMGKSVLLANLARKIIRTEKDRIVIFTPISELIILAKSERTNLGDMKMMLESILSEKASTGDLGRAYFSQVLRLKSTRIELMLDGFDEIPSKDLEFAGACLHTLKSYTNIRLWVSTRPHFLHDLEKCLQVIGFNLQPLNKAEQCEFLMKYWNMKSRQDISSQRLADFGNHCLRKLHSSMKRRDDDIAGVPLQCRLIAEIYEKHALAYSYVGNVTSADCLPVISIKSIADLYSIVIEKKIEKYYARYSSNKYTPDMLRMANAFLAVQLLLPEWTTKFRDIFTTGLNVELQDVLNIGLLEQLSADEVVRFIHRTFAEFLVAWLIVQLIKQPEHFESLKEMLQVILESKEEAEFGGNTKDQPNVMKTYQSYSFKHTAVCYFMENLVKNSPSLNLTLELNKFSHSCVNADFPNLFKFVEKMVTFGPESKYIFLDRLLFLAVRCSSIELIDKFCQIYEKLHRKRVRDICRGTSTLLHVAIAHLDFSVMEMLITKFGFRQPIDRCDKRFRNVLRLCALQSVNDDQNLIRDKIDTINMLVMINNALLEGTDEVFYEAPHLCPEVHIEILLELLNLGANVHAVNFRGDTILHTAAKYLDANQYHRLVERISFHELKKLVWKRGFRGNTPLHVVVSWFVPLRQTLEVFHAAGANFDAINKHSESVLSLAISSNKNEETIKQLIGFGAKAQFENWTCLHETLATGNFAAFRYFAMGLAEQNNMCNDLLRDAVEWKDMENFDLSFLGIDINVRKSGSSLLHEVMHRKRFDVAKLLVEQGANLHHLNDKDETPLGVVLKIGPSRASGLKDRIPCELISTLGEHGAIDSSLMAHLVLRYIIQNYSQPVRSLDELELLTNCILAKWEGALEYSGYSEMKLLHYAAKENSPFWVGYLLSKGAEANSRDSFKRTPLHSLMIYAEGNCEDVLRMLVENGATSTALAEGSHTSLHYAVAHDRVDAVSYLMTLDNYDHILAELICTAADKGRTEIFNLLRDLIVGKNNVAKECVSKICFQGKSLLCYAARGGNPLIFEQIFEKYSEKRELEGQLLVHAVVVGSAFQSSSEGRLRILEIIVSANVALLNELDSDGKTPLLGSVVDVDILIWLLSNGANAAAVDSHQRNVAITATDSFHPKIYHELLEHLLRLGHGDLLHARGGENRATVLHHAVFKMEMEGWTLSLFQTQGVDFCAVDDKGVSVVEYAKRGGRSEDFIELLNTMV